MSDSIPPRNKRFPRASRAWQRAAPAVGALLALGKLWDNIKKVFALFWDMINNPVGWVVITSLAAAGVIPSTVTTYLPKMPAEIADPKPAAPPPPTESPKQLAPVSPVEKPKVECTTSIPLARVKDMLSDADKAPAAYRGLAGRLHCGFYLTVEDQPRPHQGLWLIVFQPRDGVQVVAEMRFAPALGAGDVVFVRGTIGGYQSGDTPVLLLRSASIQRR
jgi:hypothetical protein